MKKYEFTGKNLEKTIDEALETLGKKQEDVDIKIITEGGLFKKCKIEVCVEDNTPAKLNLKLSELSVSVEPAEEKVQEKTEDKVQEHAQENVVKEAPQYNFEKVENNETECASLESECVCEECATPQEHEKKCKGTAPAIFAKEFMEGYIKAMGATGTVSQEEKEFTSVITIDCDKNANLIGYKGEALRQLQYIVNTLEQRKNHCAKRVILNVGEYNARREDKLRELARHKAEKVLKFRRRIKLDPMNSYERRIVHEELSKMENITTHSEGIEPNRRLVIEFIN